MKRLEVNFSAFFENIGIGFKGDVSTGINCPGVQIIVGLKVMPADSWNKIKIFKLKVYWADENSGIVGNIT